MKFPRVRYFLVLGLVLLLVASLGGYIVSRTAPQPESPARKAAVTGTPSAEAQAAAGKERYTPTHVVAAVKRGWVELDLQGDGHLAMEAAATNLAPYPIELVFQSGMVLVSENQQAEALLPRSQSIFLQAGETRRELLEIAPGSCRNEQVVRPYLLCLHRYDILEPYWEYLARHPEVGPEAARTGVLIIKENLPLSAFAEFPLASGPKPEILRQAGLEVNTRYLVETLGVLRKAGYPAERLAILADPQLQMEALLDPATRSAAKHYWAMTDADEWEYWKRELTQGNPATRHFALHAIGRFYPKVAVEMLPRWARYQELSLPTRRAALLALAEVRDPRAGEELAALEQELIALPGLGQGAAQALAHWERRQTKTPRPKLAFRAGGSDLEVVDYVVSTRPQAAPPAKPEPAPPEEPAVTLAPTPPLPHPAPVYLAAALTQGAHFPLPASLPAHGGGGAELLDTAWGLLGERYPAATPAFMEIWLEMQADFALPMPGAAIVEACSIHGVELLAALEIYASDEPPMALEEATPEGVQAETSATAASRLAARDLH